MFNIGDTVLYGATGVCKIESLTERDVFGQKKNYYVLKPISQEKSTVFVPADNEALLDKMRKILSREEILEVIDSVAALEDVWVDDEAARRERFSSIIHSGDRVQVMLLIRTLYGVQEARRADGKRLHLMDERFMAEAERLLYDEFSAVLGIAHSEVVPFIIKRLEK